LLKQGLLNDDNGLLFPEAAQQGPSITGPALSAPAKDTRNKGAGSHARQTDLAPRCPQRALSPEQGPRLGSSAPPGEGPFLRVPAAGSQAAAAPRGQPCSERAAPRRRAPRSRPGPARLPQRQTARFTESCVSDC